MNGTVVVTSRSFSSGQHDVAAELAEHGLTVVHGDVRHDPAALAPVLADAVAWIAGTSAVTSGMLDAAPHLRVVARYGTGVDAVDLAAARDRAIVVTNTPGANSESVADLALALLLGAIRQVRMGDARVRRGDWRAVRGEEIAQMSIGVLGFGRIGQAFAARVTALGATVRAFDPLLPPDAALPDGVLRVADSRDLRACGAVSVHAAGARPLIDQAWLAAARGVHLVNTARAGLVVESEVAAALRYGSLASYSADSLAGEFGDAAASPLLAVELAEKVTITPHLGAQTSQAVDRMGEMAVDNVLAVLAGRTPPNPVEQLATERNLS